MVIRTHKGFIREPDAVYTIPARPVEGYYTVCTEKNGDERAIAAFRELQAAENLVDSLLVALETGAKRFDVRAYLETDSAAVIWLSARF